MSLYDDMQKVKNGSSTMAEYKEKRIRQRSINEKKGEAFKSPVKKYEEAMASGELTKKSTEQASTISSDKQEKDSNQPTFYEDFKTRKEEKQNRVLPTFSGKGTSPEAVFQSSFPKVSAVKTARDSYLEGSYQKQYGGTHLSAAPKYYSATVFQPEEKSFEEKLEASQKTPTQYAERAIYALTNPGSFDDMPGFYAEAYNVLSQKGSGYENATKLLQDIQEKTSWKKRPVQNFAQNFVGGFNSSAVSGFVNLADMVTGEAVPFIHDMAEFVNEKNQEHQQYTAALNSGKGGKVLGGVSSGLGYMAGLLATGGIKSGSAADDIVSLIKPSNMEKASRFLTRAFENPMFWTTFLSSSGSKYSEERQSGVDKSRAVNNSVLTGLMTALTEIAGGIGADDFVNKGAIRNMIEEMTEEDVQNFLGSFIDKITTHPETKWFSNNAQEAAVFNPARGLETAIVTGPTSLIAGSVYGANLQSAAKTTKKVVSNISYATDSVSLGKQIKRDDRVLIDVIDKGKASNKQNVSSEANRLEEKMLSGKTLSDKEVGELAKEVYAVSKRADGKITFQDILDYGMDGKTRRQYDIEKTGEYIIDRQYNAMKRDGLFGERKKVTFDDVVNYQPKETARQSYVAPKDSEIEFANKPGAVKSPAEMEIIKKEYAAAVDSDLAEFAEYAVNNPTDNKSAYQMKPVTQRQAEDIRRLTGVDASGFGTEAKVNAFRHIENDHGENGTTDKSMADINDVARMQYVIDNYDSMELLPSTSKEFLDRNQKKSPLVRMVKRVNGNYYVVEAVPDTNKQKVEIVSAYKEAVHQKTNAKPLPNVRNDSDVTASAISIPQNPEKSNRQFMESVKKGQAVVEDSGAGKVSGTMGVRQSAQWKAAVNLMEMLSRTTGTKFVGFDGARWDEGHYDPKTRTAYINRNSERPFSWIVFHEFGHDLRVNDRAAYNALVQWTRNNMNLEKFNQYRADLLATYDEIGAKALGFDYHKMSDQEISDLVMEEAVCDLIAEVLQDPKAIRKIAAQDMSLAEKLVTYLDEFIQKISAALGYSDPEVRALVNNFEETKRVYESILENSAKLGSRSEGVDGNIKRTLQKGLDENSGDVVEYNEQDIINEVLSQVKVRRVKIKQFPKGHGKQANAISTRWAYRKDIHDGDQNIVFFRERCYIIEKYDSVEFKYQIVGATEYQEYKTLLNEVRENANAAKGQSAETMATNYGERFVPGNRIRGKRPSFDDASSEYRGENRSIRQLDENQNSQGKTERYASGSDASNSRNRENSTGRGGVKYSAGYDSLGQREEARESRKSFADNSDDAAEYNRDSNVTPSAKNPVTKISYSPSGIKLSKREYAKFASATSTDYYKPYKTHEGLQYQSCVMDDTDKHILYIYEDGGFDNYHLVARVDYRDEDVAVAIMEVLDYEKIDGITEVINAILKTHQIRQSGYSLYNAGTRMRRSSRGNGVVSSRTPRSNTRGTNGDGDNLSSSSRRNESQRRNIEQQDIGEPVIKRSVSRKQRAQDAIEKYQETGDARELPERAWSNTYLRDSKNKSRYLLNQMLGLEYELEFADEASRDAIQSAISDLQKKIEKASQNEGVAVELHDILDNVTLERNINLAPVISDLVDIDGGFKMKNGNYRYNDFYRNMERFFGKHFHLVKPLIDSFDGAKGDFARMQVELLFDMKQYIVKELGIKPGSKESKAVQWIAEKKRNPLTKEEIKRINDVVLEESKARGLTDKQAKDMKKSLRVDYTEDMLYREFGKEKAERILKAEAWFRQQYDKLIEEINKTQAMIYPNRPDDKQIPKRADYMRHFREIQTGFRGLQNIAEMDNNISPALVLVSDHTKPKEKWASIKQERTGEATDEGAIEGFLDYLPQAAYAIHINPYIDRFRGLARDISELKQKDNDRSANGFIKYLNDYANHISGKSSSLERSLIDNLGSNGRQLAKTLNWFNNRTKANAVLGNIGSVSKQVMNIPNGVKLLDNPTYILRGITDFLAGMKNEGSVRANYKKSDFLAERFLEKGFAQFEKNGLTKGTKWLLGAADEMGTRIIWNAAYREGQELSKAGQIQETPERYADILTRKAVAGRGVGEVPLAYQSQIGKLILPFQIEVSNSWNVDRDVLAGRGGKDAPISKKQRAINMTVGYLATWALGSALEALVGSAGGFNPLDDILDGILQGWKEKENEDPFTRILQAGKRAGQNLAGDFIGNRAYGWALGEVLGMIDEDWATNFFNDRVYASQGVNIPAVQSATKAVKKGIDVWKEVRGLSGVGKGFVRTGTELTTSFALPFGGKQLDKSIRGISDYAKGGKYENDIYEELSTGERGDLRYKIEQTPGNLIKSALFGPNSLKEGQEYWEGKDREAYQKTSLSAEEKKQLRAFVKDYNKENPGGEVKQLYDEVKDFSVYPYTPIRAVQTFERDKKEYSFSLLPAERKAYQEEQNRLMEEEYEKVFASEEYRSGDAETKKELLKSARREAETTVRELMQNEYLYKDKGEYGRFLAEGEHIKRTSDGVDQARASELLSYAKTMEKDGKVTKAVASSFLSELQKNRKETALDKELERLESVGAEVSVMSNAAGLFSYSKNSVDYVIPVPASQVVRIYTSTEVRVRDAMSLVIASSAYKNATVSEKKKMLSKAKSDARADIRDELKRKYGGKVEDDFSKIMRMK